MELKDIKMKTLRQRKEIIEAAICNHGLHTTSRTAEIDALIENCAEMLSLLKMAKPYLVGLNNVQRSAQVGEPFYTGGADAQVDGLSVLLREFIE